MVLQNIAEAEFDTDRGEISLFSRHIFHSKGRKIVGAVSILLVQNENGNSEILHNHSKLSLPSSLSVISLPHFERKEYQNEDFNTTSRGQSPYKMDHIHSDVPSEPFTRRMESSNSKSDMIDLDRNTLSFSQDGYTNNSTKRQNATFERHIQAETGLSDSFGYSADSSTRNVSVLDFTNCAREISEERNVAKSVVEPTVTQQHYSSKKRHVTSASDTRIPRINPLIVQDPVTNQRLNYAIMRARVMKQKLAHPQHQRSIQKHRGANHSSNNCSVCGEEINTCDGVLYHSEIHNMPQKCVICGCILSSKNNLKRHAACHVSNVLYTCHVCSAMFRRKDNMNQHLKLHELRKGGTIIKRKPYRRFAMQKNTVPKKKVTRTNTTEKESYFDKQDSLIYDDVLGVRTPNPPEGEGKTKSELQSDCEDIKLHATMLENALADSSADDHTNNGDKSTSDFEARNGQIIMDNLPRTFGLNSPVFKSAPLQDECNIKDNNSPGKDQEENYVMLYSCNTCGVQFHKLDNLKRHAITVHSEKSSEIGENNENLQTSVSSSDCTKETMLKSTDAETVGVTKEIYSVLGDEVNVPLSSELHQTSLPMQPITSESLDSNQYHPTMKIISTTNNNTTSTANIVNNIPAFASPSPIGYTKDDVIDIEKLGELSSNLETGDNSDTSFEVQGMSLTKYIKTETENVINQWSNVDNPNISGSNYPYFIDRFDTEKSVTTTLGNESSAGVWKVSPKNKKLRVHKQKPICSSCGVVFQTAEEIIRHGEIHQSELLDKFTCIACGTVLSSKDNLRRHAVNHMGISHPCPYCMVKFTRLDNLKKHVKVTHGQVL